MLGLVLVGSEADVAPYVCVCVWRGFRSCGRFKSASTTQLHMQWPSPTHSKLFGIVKELVCGEKEESRTLNCIEGSLQSFMHATARRGANDLDAGQEVEGSDVAWHHRSSLHLPLHMLSHPTYDQDLTQQITMPLTVSEVLPLRSMRYLRTRSELLPFAIIHRTL